MATETKTERETVSARAAARILGRSHPTVLQMLEDKRLPGRFVDGRWEIPRVAVHAARDAVWQRWDALGKEVVPADTAATFLASEWSAAMVDALATEIHSARDLVAAYQELKAQRDKGAAPVIGLERLENLDAVLARHHQAVATVEDLRRLRPWVDAAKVTADAIEREMTDLTPSVRMMLKAMREGDTLPKESDE